MNNKTLIESIQVKFPYGLVKMWDTEHGIVALGDMPSSELTEVIVGLANNIGVVHSALNVYSGVVTVEKCTYVKKGASWDEKKGGYSYTLSLQERTELASLPGYSMLYPEEEN